MELCQRRVGEGLELHQGSFSPVSSRPCPSWRSRKHVGPPFHGHSSSSPWYASWPCWPSLRGAHGRHRRPRTVTADVAVKPAPDITREDLDATALPEDGWLNLARELMEKGELRLALRALYLATLACLARQELITIAKYKSDREYELELRRRSHTRPQLAGVFAENRALFESAWYGLHEVTPGIMERFPRNQERIKDPCARVNFSRLFFC